MRFQSLFCLFLVLCSAQSTSAQEDVKKEKPKGPARFETEIQKFEAADQASAPAGGAIVFYGSSSARLWNLPVAFPDLPTINRGFGGSDMEAAAHFYDRVVPVQKPRVVVLYEGDNDLNAGRTPCQILADFETLLTRHQAKLPGTKLICLSIKFSPSRAKLRLDQEAANALLKARCARDPQLQFVDVATGLLGTDGQPDPRYFQKDMLHLNPDGYAVWNAQLGPILKKMMTDTESGKTPPGPAQP